jgi:hypothetical protein
MIDLADIVPMPIGMRLIEGNADYWAGWWRGRASDYANKAALSRIAAKICAEHGYGAEASLCQAYRYDLIADACLANAIGWASRCRPKLDKPEWMYGGVE